MKHLGEAVVSLTILLVFGALLYTAGLQPVVVDYSDAVLLRPYGNNPLKPNPTPYTTPNPNNEVTNGMRENAIWCTVNDDAEDIATEAVAGNFDVLNLQVGNWMVNSEGTVYDINEWYSVTSVKNWVAAAKAVDPTLKVYAWVLHMVGYNGETENINVDDAANRAGIVSIASWYIVTNTDSVLDGFCEDIESISGANPNLAVLWGALGDAMHGIGKETGVCPLIYTSGGSLLSTGGAASTLYPVLDKNKIDVVYPMMYPDEGGPYNPTYTKQYMNWIFLNCGCNIAVGLCVRPQGPYSITLSQQLAGIDEQLAVHGDYNNFVGCCLWEYDTILTSDWIVWNAWATKNDVVVEGTADIAVVAAYQTLMRSR